MTDAMSSFSRGGTPTPVQPDFMNLQSQWSTLSPTGVQLVAYKATFKTTRTRLSFIYRSLLDGGRQLSLAYRWSSRSYPRYA